MSQPSLTIPLRSSSMNAQTTGMRMTNRSQENLRCEKSSKAHKILGTTDMSFQEHKQDDTRRNVRASFMRTSENKSTKSGTFVPFPSANLDTSLPPQHLRVRASSPLLGQEYRSQDVSPPLPKSSKKVHQFGSSSTLFSYFSSREPTAEQSSSHLSTGAATRSRESQQGGPSPGRGSNLDSRMSPKQAKAPVKESKRKMRPPRIDLSLLFPKPRETAAPLLSPQRLTSSPSPISVTSEYPSTKMKGPEPPTVAKRLTKTPPTRSPAGQLNTLQENDNIDMTSAVRESENLDYLGTPFERTVRTSEFDMALDKYYDAKSLKSIKSAQSGPSVFNSHSPNNTRARDPKSTENALRKMSSSGSVKGWSKETYLSPKTCAFPRPNRKSDSLNIRKSALREDRAVDKGSMSKKSSKSTLRNVDLNNSSILCLSSSEDESDGDEAPSKEIGESHNLTARDSIITFEDEFNAEICMASAAQATRGSTLRRVDLSKLSSKGSSQTLQNNSSVHRNPSMSSAGKLSSATRKSLSRPSSGIPTISEPDNDDIFSQFRNPPLSQKERDRRSRVMAVTRQEEHLLEAMRQRKGKITPSIFQQAQYNTSLEPDQGSMLSSPSRDSFYGSHTFLRLSPGLPPQPSRVDQGATYHDKSGIISQGAASDAEQKTINSSRASLAYSESLPSPATSAASPLTPTLPIHRFSPLPSQKPPPRRPPPAVPQAQRRHSRRRTDSSEAIALDGAEESGDGNEFPIWALEWNQTGRSLAAVH
ncbi:hypothetical protein IFM46972_00849 [Aspergillus udagawae]|uniref:Uncharacterized protein n=1 Tax=Aspergillus udagawae TaxID=91492 RepID=A0A8H3N134_9EURO|nr:uncharacterized protein Aud_004081 [Aspergillus udagawae]GFF23907.1 hypothetical protein IFM46972_00849 [Aspergillus udagawae]GIC87692.1 hypothetical protein Aud_004081 [Aspergillus udagawae]